MAQVRMNYKDIVAGVLIKLKENGIKAYDKVELNTEVPFCLVELVRTAAENTKTTYRDKYTVWIHAFADGSVGSIAILDLAQNIQEALTEDILIPDPFMLISQNITGMNSLFEEPETGEKHAIVEVELLISYGYALKV